MKIFIYGTTGIGKTTYSKRLCKEKKLSYISGDDIKKELYLPSEEAKHDEYIRYGASLKNSYRDKGGEGVIYMRKGINNFVKKYLSDKDDFVFDSAYLDPRIFMDIGQVYLFVGRDKDIHKSRLFGRDIDRGNDINSERLYTAREAQDWLEAEAKKLDVQIIEV